MIKCPECGTSDVDVDFSVCKDPECCGCPDDISCNNCNYYFERYSYDDEEFVNKLLELGMTQEEIEKAKR